MDGRCVVDPIVSTEWLAAELPGADLAVLDATWYMPGDKRDARAQFAAGRIPGARYFDIDLISDRESGLPHMVPAASRFAQLVGELGVSNDHRVVFYDQIGVFSSARGRWMMRLFGHERVTVLDGGLPKWRAEGRAVESGPFSAPEPAVFRTALRAGMLRGLGDLLENLGSQRELVLDARSADRFHARVGEPRPGLRGGHMPGAHNLPFGELLTPAQTLRPREELRERFARAGVKEGTTVVTSCGSGLTAAILNLGLSVAGLPEGALYDGSWAEWGGRADTPIAKD
jgi:thiosulfate/3-mercaptopyruvate sulfurtransferase